jgi:hypothetical protein
VIFLRFGVFGSGRFSGGTEVAVAHDTTPFVTSYPWSVTSGFGTKLADPASLAAGNAKSIAFTTGAVAVAVTNNPTVAAWPWTSAGFGTKYADPAAATGLTILNNAGIAYSPDATQIVVGSAVTTGSDRLLGYNWSSSGFGTKLTNPAIPPAGVVSDLKFSIAGDYLISSHLGEPYTTSYNWSSSGFGTKLADPAQLPAGNGQGVAFSVAGDAVAIANNASSANQVFTLYPWTSSGYGTRYRAAAVSGSTAGRSVDFHPITSAIAGGASNSTGGAATLMAWPWSTSTGFGTIYASPATPPDGTVNGVKFHPSGLAAAVANTGTTNRTDAWSWNVSGGFGTKYANAPTQPTGTGNRVEFSV